MKKKYVKSYEIKLYKTKKYDKTEYKIKIKQALWCSGYHYSTTLFNKA